MVKRTITITTILIIALNRASFAADDDIASGTSGTCSWVIDKDGVLTISPTDGVSGTLDNTRINASGYNNDKWFVYNLSVKKVIVNPGVKVNTIGAYLFHDFRNCTEMDISNLDTSNVTNMRGMFYNCSGLTSLDVTGFDTSKVTDMTDMFVGCGSLTNLDVSGFDTSKVTDMTDMFAGCRSLTTLDVSGFDTSKVTRMEGMFAGCSSLTNLDVTNFDTSNVIYMSRMFIACSNIKTIDLTGFNTSNVTKMNNMFNGCDSLTSIDVSGFNTSKVTRMEAMFCNCYSLTNLDVTNFDTSKVTDMTEMFASCSNLKNLDVSGFNTSEVTSMRSMFNGCSNLTNLDVSGFDTSKVTNMSDMFNNCSALTTLDVTGFNTSNVKNMYGMFWRCRSLTNLNVAGFNTSKVTSMYYMFCVCDSLTNLDVTNFDTSEVTAMTGMFSNCSKLTSLDVTGFDTSKVTNMSDMFNNCSGLTSLDVTGFNTSKVTNMESIFSGCENITNLDLSGWETSSATTMRRMFSNCSSLKTLDISNFDTRNVENFEHFFYKDRNLSSIKVGPNFDPIAKTKGNQRLTLDIKDNSLDSWSNIYYWVREDNVYGPFRDTEWSTLFERETMYGNWKRISTPRTYSVEYYVEGLKENEFDFWNKNEFDASYLIEIEEDTETGEIQRKYDIDKYNHEIEGFNYKYVEEDWQNYTLKLYYKRNSYNISYSYVGQIPDCASELPENQTYKYEEEISLPENPTAPGYTFSGWQTDYITMPAEDIEITGYFIKDDVSKEYKIEYYFDGEKDDSLDETMNAEIDEEISIDPQKSLNFNNTHYSLVSENHKINVSENTEDNVIRVYYETDVLDYKNEESTSGDGISDKYQVKIVYKVQNGTWDDGTSEDKKQIINLYDKDGNPAENGTGKITTPEVGSKPNEGYKEGSWNIELPNEVTSKEIYQIQKQTILYKAMHYMEL